MYELFIDAHGMFDEHMIYLWNKFLQNPSIYASKFYEGIGN